MKNILKHAALALFGGASLVVVSCSDFEEVNTNPHATDATVTPAYFALNNSIIYSQQNPDTAERLFVINWAAHARQYDGSGCEMGSYNDGYNNASYNHMYTALKLCTDAITLSDTQIAAGSLGERDVNFLKNMTAFARIWRAYLMSEFADSFGPMPVAGFQGVNPEFNSVKEVYYYMYKELAEAIAAIDTAITPTDSEKKCDPAYGYDAAKWKKYGISLWMRLAMRLSIVDAAKAKAEFEAAVAAGEGITAVDETFRVKERPGWDALSGVMTRTWNYQSNSATIANLACNLGGTDILEVMASADHIYTKPDSGRYRSHIKDASTYLGKRFEKHSLATTDNPTQGFFFDGLPSKLDPRMIVYFCLPGDWKDRIHNTAFPYWDHPKFTQEESMYDPAVEGELTPLAGTEIDATYCWNGPIVGYWNDKTANYNGVYNGKGGFGVYGCHPLLADEYRSSDNYRVFFGPWETYFLLAEAAVRGWTTKMSDEDAYNAGIKASLEYNGLGKHYATYIEGENYNRVGTSVKFTHTAEPTDVEMEYVNGYTGKKDKITYKYPDASKILYPGKKLNDKITKIITQKYIANMPWLPLESWSDHRRLGLPFFEIPASSTTIDTMPEFNPETSYQGAQKPGYFSQRMKYPSSLANADPTGYAKALELLGGEDVVVTPLWWAIGGNK
ncbi:SusD/RagB family nutrient-binding outer membrane lipoprotein [Alistipes sp.]|uniref:SusD/RagB family nutrient-binding outer membrane lipoprotein n=1 Tax=Alistipes sp. TaxID=1872444 RepID=UPI0025C1CA1E|nr:SusD/RagB family nutrient-binding outer membrane lipoprotein [Alistipes sp.]